MGNQTTKPSFGLDIAAAREKLKEVVKHTPLIYNASLSKKYDCSVYLKREDLQIVRSYKLRGAYNMISSLPEDQRAKGVVCARDRVLSCLTFQSIPVQLEDGS